jgi:hypothetical protein
MSTSSDLRNLAGISGLLGIAALVELVLLRVGTRTLVHIPGLGRYEAPISILAELGRFAYYLAVVCLVTTLTLLAYQALRIRTPRLVVIGIGVLGFLAAAGAGRLGVISTPIVGWSSVAVLVMVCAASWGGLRTIPIAFFVFGSVAAGWTVLGQGPGGGLSGRQVDGFMLAAEIALILSAITVPLLLKGPPSKLAILVGLFDLGDPRPVESWCSRLASGARLLPRLRESGGHSVVGLLLGTEINGDWSDASRSRRHRNNQHLPDGTRSHRSGPTGRHGPHRRSGSDRTDPIHQDGRIA